MKKIILSSLLAAVLGASEYNYEISPMVGYVFPNATQDLKNHSVFGAEMQFNTFDLPVKPELSVLFSRADYENSPLDTDIFRSALNGVYEFQNSDNITPFVKAGLGYETMSEHQYDNHDSVFVDAGAGIKVALSKQIALKLEAIEMFKRNHSASDNNLLLMAGINFAFGEKTQPAPPVETPQPTIKPEPKAEPEAVKIVPVVVTTILVPAPAVDSDKDGVYDDFDKCPDTPARFQVDKNGCPLKKTLHLHFFFDSTYIDQTGASEVSAFAVYMKENPTYKAFLVGHTDSVGEVEYNKKLSLKRADAVKAMLVKEGVEADRMQTDGEGESMPIATNETEQGRLENRRIEIELCK